MLGVTMPCTARCSCDDFCDSPCEVHGFGYSQCVCGARIRAPLVIRDGYELQCEHCGQCYVGVEDAAHGYWEEVDKC
jgi:hypothetical protein